MSAQKGDNRVSGSEVPAAEKCAIREAPEITEEDSGGLYTKHHVVFVILYVLVTVVTGMLSYWHGVRNSNIAGGTDAGAQMIIESLWATPLARTHLRTHPAVRNVSEFNENLVRAVAEDHGAFVKMLKERNGDMDSGDVNDAFFEHQCGRRDVSKDEDVRMRVKKMSYRQGAEFSTLARAAATLAERMLGKFGDDMVDIAEKRLQAWATLHEGGSHHNLHVHSESTLSIVYYAKMGAGVGLLRLYDPRGPRPPFEGSIEVRPEEGEMIAFPGWLAHEVEAGEGVRVSLVFNVPGAWEGTDEFGENVEGMGRWQRVKGWRLDHGGRL